jgi:hypothetical protein
MDGWESKLGSTITLWMEPQFCVIGELLEVTDHRVLVYDHKYQRYKSVVRSAIKFVEYGTGDQNGNHAGKY